MNFARTIAGAVVVAAALTACTSEPQGPTSSPSPPQSATQSPAPSTATVSPEDEAAAAAEEVLRAYYRSFPVCMSDPPNSKPTCFDQVAIGTELINMRNTLAAAQGMETRVAGTIAIASVERLAVDLTSKLEETPPIVPTVTLRACADVSAYSILDKDGASIVPADRKPRSLIDVSVYNYKLPDATQWRVGYVVPVKGGSC